MDIFLAVYFIFISGVFGVIIGSFLNVVIYRLPAGRTIVKGHSMCMTCGHKLGAKDLIPIISWATLKGKCRYCGAPIASRYTKIESFTGVLFLIASVGVYKYAYAAIINLGYNQQTFFLLYFISYVLLLAACVSSMMIYYDTGSNHIVTAVWAVICVVIAVILPPAFGILEGGIVEILINLGVTIGRICAVCAVCFLLALLMKKKYTKGDVYMDITLSSIFMFGYYYQFTSKWLDFAIYGLTYSIARAVTKNTRSDKYFGIATVCILQAVSVVHIIYMFLTGR